MGEGKKKNGGENWIYAYYQGIKDGTHLVGRWIRLLYEYLIKGLQEKQFFFDAKKATAAVKFMEEHTFHTEGPLAPGRMCLEVWQKAMISAMYGIVDKDGHRQFREILLLVGRKNGKSKVASGNAKYVWLENGGYGARVFCVAPKLDQADIVYNDVWQMVLLDPEWQELKAEIEGSKDVHKKKQKDDSELARHRMSDLYLPSTNSTVKKIAFSAKRSDGFNPSLTICDEIAAWEGDKGLKQYEVMKSGMGARPEGMILSCTTSGYVNDGIFDELMKRSTRFLMGDSKEKRLLPFLYMIDDAEKWNDINELRKANPNLGVSVSVDYMLEEVAIAEGSLSKKAEFLTKYCCLKQNSSQAWLSTETVGGCVGPELDPAEFRNFYAVGGIDLSQTTDLTAACVVIEKDGRLNVLEHFWLPAEKIDEATARDGLPYRAYIARGILSPSGDNFVDYHDVFNWFRELVEKWGILPLKVGYDRYSAQYLVQDMKNYGFHMDDVYQGWNLSPVLKEMEGLMKDGAVNIGENDLLRVHLLDSALKLEAETNKVKLIKVAPTAHIDGVAALSDAFTVRQKYYAEIGGQLRNEGK